jgi:DNA-directed RNA polymerase specialized sigma24 family protein
MEVAMATGVFDALDEEWRRLEVSDRAASALARWKVEEPALERFDSVGELFDALRDGVDDGPAVMRTIVRLGRDDALARRLALQRLAPGLARAARAYSLRWGSDESAAMVLCFALERLAGWNDSRAACPASAIVLEARRLLFVSHRRERDREDAEQPLMAVEPPVSADASAGETLVELLVDAVNERQLDVPDAEIIFLTRIAGSSTAEVAKAVGCTAGHLRNRRTFAERALRRAVAEVA